MNLFADIRNLILDRIATLSAEGVLPQGLPVEAITVEPPRDRGHGDMATNAAMVLAKPAGLSSRVRREPRSTLLPCTARFRAPVPYGPGELSWTLSPISAT